MEDKYQFFLQDICSHLLEKALNSSKVDNADDFELGYNMAMYEVISLIHQQAKVFGISNQEIALGDLNPERDLLHRSINKNNNQ